jgi:hypothetical protein
MSRTRSFGQTSTSLLLLVGGVLAAIGNALHPHAPTTDRAATIVAIATDGAWVWIHLAIILGVLLIVGGLVGLSPELVGRVAEPFARLGVAAALVGGAVVTVSTAVDGFGMKALADGVASGPSSEAAGRLRAAVAIAEADFGVWSIGMLVLFGAAFGCFAIAIATSRRFPAWNGLLAALGAAGAAVAALDQIAVGGESQTAETLFLVGSVLLTVWVLVTGVQLWRGLPEAPAAAIEAHVAGGTLMSDGGQGVVSN